MGCLAHPQGSKPCPVDEKGGEGRGGEGKGAEVGDRGRKKKSKGS